jgi:septal ring factor EnvC (AmiA/AmiB activator)
VTPPALPPRRLLLLLCGWLLLPLACPAAAQSEEERTRDELRRLEQDIQRITREVASATARRDKLQAQLREAEVEFGELQRELGAIRDELDAGEAELAALEARQVSLEQARADQEAHIALEMNAAWRSGQQAQVKLLLSQEDPHAVARNMAYFRYLLSARGERVEEYRATLAELAEVGQRVEATLATLASRRDAVQEQQTRVNRARANRELALLELGERINSGAERLAALEADRRELEQLLEAIENAVIELQVPADFQAFSDARGSMPWPVSGKASNRFGARRNTADMRWQGLKIPAEEGTLVRAIHHGRVVYADWLRGSGLLLILDHGEGYMSLYAHNQSLLKDVGEWVTAGTPISTVGSSGGQQRSALYFEVRHDGTPVDPRKWCRS